MTVNVHGRVNTRPAYYYFDPTLPGAAIGDFRVTVSSASPVRGFRLARRRISRPRKDEKRRPNSTWRHVFLRPPKKIDSSAGRFRADRNAGRNSSVGNAFRLHARGYFIMRPRRSRKKKSFRKTKRQGKSYKLNVVLYRRRTTCVWNTVFFFSFCSTRNTEKKRTIFYGSVFFHAIVLVGFERLRYERVWRLQSGI